MHHFTTKLLEWYARNGRSLPWRETNDPYAIWLSEIILQQTRVQQGMDYWYRFMRRWPDVESLAQATEDEVLRMWQGLGYYSRARHLHVAARQIASMSRFPDTTEEIRKLKGVGDYTAAAIASFAFGLPVAAVDGNVFRVLSRVFGITTPINSNEGKKEFAALAQSLLPASRPADFNQAMMDFGSLLCTPKSPGCTGCCMQEICVAWRENRVGELPVKLSTMKVRQRHLVYYYLRCDGFTAIHQRGAGDIWQGLWEPYLVESPVPPSYPKTSDTPESPQSPEKPDFLKTSETHSVLTLLASGVKHVLTHRILVADFYLWQTSERPVLPPGFVWIPESDIEHYAIPRLVERLLAYVPPAG